MTDVVPFSETCIWRYLQQLKDEDAPCTKGSSALSAFRFAHHILGFEDLGPALVSRRLVGICELMLSKKRLLKQARVLTVAQVKGATQVTSRRELARHGPCSGCLHPFCHLW